MLILFINRIAGFFLSIVTDRVFKYVKTFKPGSQTCCQNWRMSASIGIGWQKTIYPGRCEYMSITVSEPNRGDLGDDYIGWCIVFRIHLKMRFIIVHSRLFLLLRIMS